MRLIVGCPVRRRNWVMPSYIEHVLGAVRKTVSLELTEFIFVVGEDDVETIDSINYESQLWGVNSSFIPVKEDPRGDLRVWNDKRYDHMVYLRNLLLSQVRVRQPDYFLSLDSDILLHPEILSSALPSFGSYGALGFHTYMTPQGTWCTSGANLGREMNLIRAAPTGGTAKVDVIMAAKLMRKSAYEIDYVSHKLGEDIGWSLACKKAGVQLGWCSAFASKHVMTTRMLQDVDSRCGF